MANDITLPLSTWPSTSWQFQLGKAAELNAGNPNGASDVSLVDLDTFEATQPLPAGISPEDANELRKEIVLQGSGKGKGSPNKTIEHLKQLATAVGATDQIAPMDDLAKAKANWTTGAQWYPNGQEETDGNDNWWYPKGQIAMAGAAAWYPNGQEGTDGNNNWWYPTGQIAST